jgi:hypothetical protein
MPRDLIVKTRFNLGVLRKSFSDYTQTADLMRLDLAETVRATRKTISESRALLTGAESRPGEQAGCSRNFWLWQLARMEAAVAQHRFKVGQIVNYMPGPFGRGHAGNIYKITQLLPPEGDDFQYRIKSAAEPHERVVKESQLDRAA